MKVMWLLSVVVLAGLALGVRSEAREGEGFQIHARDLALKNDDFRKVVFSGSHEQVVLMSLKPGEDIGLEVHGVDQCFYFVAGKGESRIAGATRPFAADDIVCVPAGARHDIKNTGTTPLKLFTIYAPPQHPAGTVHHTKADAEATGH